MFYDLNYLNSRKIKKRNMNNNPMKDNFPYNLDSKTLKSHSDTDNISLLKTTCQTDNLKVVIRIRPALPREMENDIPFRSIVKKLLFFLKKFKLKNSYKQFLYLNSKANIVLNLKRLFIHNFL